ncbi:MAG: alanine racemase, partial [Methylophilaceae bacterium]|nr:alanine racemase [Methylophilaceae bacterium]
MRPTFANISSSALKHNLQRLRQYAPHAKIMAVVKTDAYGHGLLAVAQALNDADGFAVLSVDEAVQLRDAGIDRPILILSGPFEAQELHAVAGLELDIAVHSLQQLAWLESFKPRQRMSIHLNIDTGMHRLGLSMQEFQTALDVLQRIPHLK